MHEGRKLHFYAKKAYPQMSLKEAREWAVTTKAFAIENSIAAASELSLGYFLSLFREQQVSNGRKQNTIAKLDMRANKYLSPYLASDVRTFTAGSILDILRPIGQAGKLEAQAQTRELLSNVFLHSILHGVRETNPVTDLHKILPKRNVTHRASVTDVEGFRELLIAIHNKKSEAYLPVRKALELAPLVFLRPENIRFAEWSEINFKKSMWSIPGRKMKMKEPLEVPLSRQALEIFQEMKKVNGVHQYVFAMPFKESEYKPFSEVTLRGELIRLGYYGAHMRNVPANARFHSPHGFRATFRTIADEILRWSLPVIELQLGHVVKDANGNAYNRTTHLDERIPMMQIWADFCEILRTGTSTEIDEFILKVRKTI